MNEIRIISPHSPLYSPSFLQLKPPPTLLFAIGNLNLLQTYTIAIVGARACTPESIFFTKQLVNELSLRNITILSGMADGIDTIAHEACLQSNGKTIAIIGSGFDAVKRKPLFQKILDHDGLILSEYFPDIPAMPYHFPRRNMLLVTLSKGVVAVETHLKSGTMITAKEALHQHIPLYTIPGGLHDSKYAGNNLLLTKGAICITNYSHILQHIHQIHPEIKTPLRGAAHSSIPHEYQTILAVLNDTPQNINVIAKKANIPMQEVQRKLMLMELDDYVNQFQQNYFIKK